MQWQVTVVWTATTDRAPEETADDILGELEQHHAGAVSFPDGRYCTTITVDAKTLRQASATGLQLVTAAAGNAGHRGIVPVELEVLDEASSIRKLMQPDIPLLVGLATVAELAGVSRTRARQIALDRPDFPPVALDTEYGPLYVREAVEAFLRKPRKAGRPKKVAAQGTPAG